MNIWCEKKVEYEEAEIKSNFVSDMNRIPFRAGVLISCVHR